MARLKEETETSNADRRDGGFEPVQVVGWAVPPFYDAAARKAHWAKELKFGEDAANTLNYSIRVLGREGFLVLNFVAGMHQLDEINEYIHEVAAMANFNDGHRYEDFDPRVDQVARYGVSGLIGGGAKAGGRSASVAETLVMTLEKYWIGFVIVVLFATWQFVAKRRSN